MRRRVVALVVLGVAGLAAPGTAAAAGWCGKGEVKADRPDLVGGKQIRVLYVVPADGDDRFAQIAPRIANDLAVVEAWWRREDPTRAPRFDLYAFPGCAPGTGRLDIGFVRLAQPASDLFDPGFRLPLLSIDLELADVGSSFADSFKKLLVFYDGPVDFADQCAVSFSRPKIGGARSMSGIWLRAAPGRECGTVGRNDYAALALAHELVHLLGGAVPNRSPHECPDSPGHVCDDPHDVMYGLRHPVQTLAGNHLDVGHDDYYAHSGSWWDVQDSEWLRRLDTPDMRLQVEMANARAGDTVTSDVPGIACGEVCATTLEPGTSVTLKAKAGKGSRFVGWAGACTGRGECTLAMGAGAAATVRAIFRPTTFRMTVRVTGRGRVETTGLSCVATCSATFAAGSAHVFRAVAARGWRFEGWTGACTGRARCRVGLTADRRLGAVFRRDTT